MLNLTNFFYRVIIKDPENNIIEDFDVGSMSSGLSMAYYYLSNMGYEYVNVVISHEINGLSSFRIYKNSTKIS